MKRNFFLFLSLIISFSVFLPACSGQDKAISDAYSLLNKKENEKAQEAFSNILKNDSSNIHVLIGHARAFANTGDHEKALLDLNKAVNLATKGTQPDSLKANAYYYRGLSNYAMGSFDQSLTDLTKAIELKYSDLGDAYGYRGIVKGLLQQDFEAVDDFNKSLSYKPDNHFVLSNRGYYNSKLGDNVTAIKDLTRAVEIDPKDKVSFLNRGYTYLNMQDYPKALDDFFKSLAIDSTYLGPIAYIGITMTNMGDNVQALPWHNKAVALQPENGTLYYYRGVCQLNLNHIIEGCEDLRKALALGDPSGKASIQDFCK